VPDCAGDFMGTSQSKYSNPDGATYFYYYTDGYPLYDYTACEPGDRDGCHGMRLFIESRGYTVTNNFTQLRYGYNGNTRGFTFANYKAEIDAGRPVMIHLNGHTVLGCGYNDSGSIVYHHNTWDHDVRSMTWGGSYSGMSHVGVTVMQLQPARFTLTVVSAHNGAYPGTVTTNYNTMLSQYVTNSPVAAGVSTQNVCIGAAVTGNSYTVVSPTQITLTLTNQATLVWNWQTQYKLETGTRGAGQVSGASSWYPAGSNAVLTAVADPDWAFALWSGDTNGCVAAGAEITVPMTMPRRLTASFRQVRMALFQIR